MHESAPASVFDTLHLLVAAWCESHLVAPTPPQVAGVPAGAAGKNLLISSPTGTGKTLAAFLPIFSRLARRRDDDCLFPRTYALYISPLRALGYDVEHNVRRPLREMELLERPNSPRAVLRRGRIREQFVRTGVRTGDTPVEERRLMLRRPPHILMTTPESLGVMLAMPSYRRALRFVETAIVDEIHALAGNKRGAQLALLLESLEELVEAPFNRIGLSATVSPLDRVAQFLTGAGRPCEIVDARGLRSVSIDIVAPFKGAMAPLTSIARAASDLSRRERTTLVFANVRSQAERLAHEMSADGVHHSALERVVRQRVEAELRAGTLKTVVCSSSLELGVDIGWIDRVAIVGGGRGVTSTLQRIGRASHRPDAVAQGTILAQDRDDIIEAAATRRCIADSVLEEIQIPGAPLDVLAQWLAGSVCYDRRLSLDDAFRVAKRAFPYAALERSDLVRCAEYLSGADIAGEEVHARRLGYDGEAIYGLGREVCAAFFENSGTIPDERQVPVRVKGAGEGLGRVDESFANDLRVGDVFVLGGKTLRVKAVEPRGIVTEPHAGRPTVPQWRSHLQGVSTPLAHEIMHLRCGVAERLESGGPQAGLAWLRSRYALEGVEAAHVVRYIAQQAAISAVPSERRPVVELYVMDGRQTAVFHTGAGRRINETLARAAGARVHARIRANTSLTTDDGGFMISLPQRKTLPDAEWAQLLAAENFDRDLLAGLRSSHLLRNYFRYVANTGLLILRRAGGRTLGRRSLSWNSAKIFEQLYARDRKFPLIRETFRTIVRDLLDAAGAKTYLQQIADVRVLHPLAASPFTFGILTSSFGDSVVLDDRCAMVEALHARVLQILGEEPEE